MQMIDQVNKGNEVRPFVSTAYLERVWLTCHCGVTFEPQILGGDGRCPYCHHMIEKAQVRGRVYG